MNGKLLAIFIMLLLSFGYLRHIHHDIQNIQEAMGLLDESGRIKPITTPRADHK